MSSFTITHKEINCQVNRLAADELLASSFLLIGVCFFKDFYHRNISPAFEGVQIEFSNFLARGHTNATAAPKTTETSHCRIKDCGLVVFTPQTQSPILFSLLKFCPPPFYLDGHKDHKTTILYYKRGRKVVLLLRCGLLSARIEG